MFRVEALDVNFYCSLLSPRLRTLRRATLLRLQSLDMVSSASSYTCGKECHGDRTLESSRRFEKLHGEKKKKQNKKPSSMWVKLAEESREHALLSDVSFCCFVFVEQSLRRTVLACNEHSGRFLRIPTGKGWCAG